ncbi:hypothetical protein GMMP1_120025 [Candidatus Magnetomoraceae bacterium gMMP-1]
MGSNFGIRIKDNGVINLFGIWNHDVSDYDVPDENFFDLGFEIAYNITETFSLSGGYKKVLGYENFDSDMIYLGTIFKH